MNKHIIKFFLYMILTFILSIICVTAYTPILYYSFDNTTSTIGVLTDSIAGRDLIENNNTFRSFVNGVSGSGLYTTQNLFSTQTYNTLRSSNYNYKLNTTLFQNSTEVTWNYWIKSNNLFGIGPDDIISTIGFLSNDNFSFMISNDGIYTDYNWGAGDYHNLYCLSEATSNFLCTYFSTTPSPIIFNDTWYMITVTYNNSILRLYRNSNLISSKTTSIPIPALTNLLTLNYPYNSTIDELSFYDVALNQQDINSLYNTYYNNTNTTLNSNYVIGNVTYSINQCMPSTTGFSNYICYNSFIDNNYGVYCDLSSVTNYAQCSQGCINVIMDLNSTTKYFYSNDKSCSELSQGYIPIGVKLFCDLFWNQVFAIPSFYINANDCYNNGYTTIPTTSCSDNSFNTELATGHQFYIEGSCINASDQLLTDLCQTENQSVCNGNTVQTCQRDSTGYLSWNYTKNCLDDGWQYSCVAGRCQFLSSKCRTDYDCKSGEFCADEKCVTNGGNGCTADSQCASGYTCVNNKCKQKSGFGNLSLNTRYAIMLIVSILIVIMMTALMATIGDGVSGLLVGLVLSILSSLVLSIIFQLSLLIPILYILIGGTVIAIIMRRIFAGG